MKSWIIIGSILAALAVILGAFGAHGLKTRLSPEDLAIFETGVRYHIIHALGIIIIGVLGYHEPSEILKVPVIFFTLTNSPVCDHDGSAGSKLINAHKINTAAKVLIISPVSNSL